LVDLSILLTLLKNTLDVVRLLLLTLTALSGGLSGTSALFRNWLTIVRLIPLLEWRSVDSDNGALHEGIGTDKFVVRRIVHDLDDPCLLCDSLRAPCEVAGIETESTVLEVTTTSTDGVDALCTKLCAGGLATELELALLAVVGALGTCFRAFVS